MGARRKPDTDSPSQRKPSTIESRAQRKRIAFISVASLLALLLVAGTVRIITLNIAYPSPARMVFSLGEEALGGDIGVRAVSLEVFEGEEILGILPEYEETMKDRGELVTLDQVRMFVCSIVVSNHGEELSSVAVNNYVLQIGAWKNGLMFTQYPELNEGRGIMVELKPGEQVELRLAYSMYDFQFKSRSDFEKIKDKDIDLVLKSYPVKIIIRMQYPNR